MNKTDAMVELIVASVFIAIIGVFFGALFYSEGIIGPEVKIGQVWVDITNGSNPFEEHQTNTVVNVKDGYVLYQNQYAKLGTESIKIFRKYSKKLSDSPESKPLIIEDNEEKKNTTRSGRFVFPAN